MLKYIFIILAFASLSCYAKEAPIEIPWDRWQHTSFILIYENFKTKSLSTSKHKGMWMFEKGMRLIHNRTYSVTDQAAITPVTEGYDLAVMSYVMKCATTYEWDGSKSRITEDTTIEQIEWKLREDKNKKLVNSQPNNELFSRTMSHSNVFVIGAKEKALPTFSEVSNGNFYRRKQLKDIKSNLFFERNKKFLCLQLSNLRGWSNRSLYVGTQQLRSLDTFSIRQNTEHSIVSNESWSASAGISLSRNGVLSLSYLNIRQGISVDSFSIDWSTGLPFNPGTAKNTRYDFRSHGIGLLYQYCGHEHLFNLAIDAGLYSLWTKGYSENSDPFKAKNIQGIRPQLFALQGGLGINIRPAYGLEFRIVPTLLYNINSINIGGDLRTNLFNYGVTISSIAHIRL